MYSRIGTIGQARIVDFSQSFVALHSIAMVKPERNLTTTKFLFYLLKSPKVKTQAIRNIKSVGTPDLGLTRINNFSVPLPPIKEQYRITSKLDELFTRLDASVASLDNVKTQLQIYRHAVLNNAFNGKLTEDWRKSHKNTKQPATKLLEQIKQKRMKEGKFKTTKIDTSELPKLPDTWEWTTIGELLNLSAGIAFKKNEYSQKGVRLLQIANVSFGRIIWEKTSYLPLNYLEKYPKLSLKEGDILMALNRPILNGKLKIGALTRKDVPSILYQRVGRLDFFDTSMSPYVFMYLQSPFFLAKLIKSLQGVDQPFINKPRLLNKPIPIAPLLEQNVITERIERIISIINQLEKITDENIMQSEMLRNSILKIAFEGKLVAQDPAEESAKILLKRIKQEKEKQVELKNKTRKRNQRRLDVHVK